jgi:signal transduction histidine kinase
VGAVVRTMRFRVTALATVLVLGALAVGSVALVVFQRHVLVDDLDDVLADDADDLATTIDGGTIPAVLDPRGDDDVVAQVVAPDGQVLAASANLGDAQPLVEPGAVEPGAGPRTVDGIGDDDERYRLLTRQIDRGGDGQVVLVLATPLDDVDESIRVLVTSLAVGVPLLGVVLAAGVWVLVGRTLRPVERIRAEVDQIGDGRLDRRVPRPPGDDEIARLADTMNGMLDRLEAASRRQQRFVADASHELRTPLTRMRAELEVDLTHPDTADVAATNRSVLDEIATMQRLVDDLLVLARTDARAAGRASETVELDQLVTAEAERVTGGGGPVVDTSAVSPAVVVGDGDQLRRAVANLVDNAARHAATRVGVSVTQRDGRVTVIVTDDGPGIPAAERDRVFERFVRLDEARTASAGGTGLGLAIVRDIVARHHGTVVAADPGPEGGARLVVDLPAAER